MKKVIIDIKMPKTCRKCPFFDDNCDYPTCGITHLSKGYNWNPYNKRMEDCPLHEEEEKKENHWEPIPIITTKGTNFPSVCERCSNNPKNGGSGICHCVLPYMNQITAKEGSWTYITTTSTSSPYTYVSNEYDDII